MRRKIENRKNGTIIEITGNVLESRFPIRESYG